MNKTLFFSILVIKALLFILFIWSGLIGLAPDEAQYWTWSQNLDWGYYSKPPAIAWQIWAGTLLFGNTELGVRFGAVILALALPFIVYLLGKKATDSEEVGLWAGLGLALSPLGFLSSLLAITDTGMALFWALACYEMIRKQPPHYLVVGLYIGSGALFKWPIYALWIVIAAALIFYPKIRSRQAFGGFLFSLLGLLPSLYWNRQHDWATVRHVWATIVGQQVHQGTASIPVKGNFFDFLGAQIALMSPFIFVFFLIGCFFALRNWKSIRYELQFLLIATLSLLGLCLGMSLFKKMQGNWVSYVYTSAFVIAAWFCFNVWKKGRLWYPIGVIVSLTLSTIVFMIPWIQINGGGIPFKLSPFRHNMGWCQLHDVLGESGYNPESDFLFGDKYQTTSILSFYGPGQNRAYFLNLLGTRKNQFSYWPSLADERIGQSGYFVQIENNPDLKAKLDADILFYSQNLKPFFKEVHFIGIKPLFMVGNSVEKVALIYKCDHFNGKETSENQLY